MTKAADKQGVALARKAGEEIASIRTGAEYIESLRGRNLNVYLLGDRIEEPETREALEVTVVRVEFHAVLDRERREMRVRRQAPGDTRCGEEIPHDAQR